MDALYGIPVLGIVFQLLAYFVQVVPGIAPIILGLATPIALGALCGIMNERSKTCRVGGRSCFEFTAVDHETVASCEEARRGAVHERHKSCPVDENHRVPQVVDDRREIP